MCETLEWEEEPILAIRTKLICESDRKMHLFASENPLFLTIILCFIEFLTFFHEKTIGIVKFHVYSFQDICKKHLDTRDFCFFIK